MVRVRNPRYDPKKIPNYLGGDNRVTGFKKTFVPNKYVIIQKSPSPVKFNVPVSARTAVPVKKVSPPLVRPINLPHNPKIMTIHRKKKKAEPKVPNVKFNSKNELEAFIKQAFERAEKKKIKSVPKKQSVSPKSSEYNKNLEANLENSLKRSNNNLSGSGSKSNGLSSSNNKSNAENNKPKKVVPKQAVKKVTDAKVSKAKKPSPEKKKSDEYVLNIGKRKQMKLTKKIAKLMAKGKKEKLKENKRVAIKAPKRTDKKTKPVVNKKVISKEAKRILGHSK